LRSTKAAKVNAPTGESEIGRQLSARLEVSDVMLKNANQKLEHLTLEVEQRRIQHAEDECELRKRSELDSLKNEYVAMVSHELLSPLTSVKGSIGILSAGLVDPSTDKGAKMFHIALTNLERIIRLIKDALNLELLISGAPSLRMQECSLEDLARQAVDTMMTVADGADVGLTVNVVRQKGNEPLPLIQADADRILQVLINLLSNAIKFSPSMSVVDLQIESSINTLTVRISDEGRGIPTDQLEQVFHRFRQVERDDARRLGGTGLGLAICRTIVEQHGGVIWAERNPERGTSFLVTLPSTSPALSHDVSLMRLLPCPAV